MILKIDKVVVGELLENCYILSIGNDCLVVDPGDEYFKIKRCIGDKNVLAVLITHKHFDHIGALDDLLNDYNVSILNFENIEFEKKIHIGKFNFEILLTRGHSCDSVTYYFYEENIMFVGDFIFKGSIGRTDFEDGNVDEMVNSIEKIKKYSDSIVLYPGHGDSTTLGYEKKYNYYFNCRF